jgi:hypothetical protein
MENPHFFSCLSTLNLGVLTNIAQMESKAKEIEEDKIEEVPEEYDSDNSELAEEQRRKEEEKK